MLHNVPPLSRTEKVFSRLLTKIEKYVQQRDSNDWRLKQYVKGLESRLVEVRKMNTCQPDPDALADYSRRIDFLSGIVDAEKLPTLAEKAAVLLPGADGSLVRQQTKAQLLREMREELLGSEGEVRLRGMNSSPADLDAVLQYHNSMQEKVAHDMVSLVQNLKSNSLLAGHIIKKDNETLQKSSSLADDRYSQLKSQSDKLEKYRRNPCNWLIWMMLGLVCLVFLWMIVFIRLFPKQ